MTRWMKLSLAALLALSLLAGCSLTAPGTVNSGSQQEEPSTSEPKPAASEPPQAEPEPSTPEDTALILLQNMTLREKVGQLFLVRPDALDLSQTDEQIKDPSGIGVTELSDAMADTLAQYPVGGIILFGKNIAAPEQTAGFIRDLQAASALPLFAAVDEEGGLVARLANNPSFHVQQYESAAAVGESGDAAAALDMGDHRRVSAPIWIQPGLRPGGRRELQSEEYCDRDPGLFVERRRCRPHGKGHGRWAETAADHPHVQAFSWTRRHRRGQPRGHRGEL